MNNIQRLERLRHFFWNLRRRWPMTILSVAAICGGVWLLKKMENYSTIWSTVVLVAIIIAVFFILLWISSFPMVARIKKKLTSFYTNGIPNATKTEEKVKISFSRLLTLRERIAAFLNFKELRDISDYCFLGGPPSYLRIQWNPEIREASQPKELVLNWPEDNEIIRGFEVNNERIQLTVFRDCSENGEKVYACITPSNPTREEKKAAEVMQLTLNEPCMLAYGFVYENPDGTEVPCDQMLCIITWIGGNY